MTYDRAYWEQLWAKTLREHPDKVAQRSPNAHLIAEVASLPPGRALDAGCGHGAETRWLAAHDWKVTSVDFSASALAALEPNAWELVVAEERARAVAGSGVDAVILARRLALPF